MFEESNIAFFIDVDNCGLTNEHYAYIIEKLQRMGRIFRGTVYGAGQRKHKEIYAHADEKGFDMVGPMRVKRRGRKDFDSRIFVDVVDAVRRAPSIKVVCIVAQPTDLVHLYKYLHGYDIKIVALANGDEASNAYIDEVLDLGIVPQAKAPKKKPAAKPAPKASAPQKAEPTPATNDESAKKPAAATSDVDRTEELLREIARLKELANDEQAKPVNEEPAVEEEPVKEVPAPKAEPAPAKEPEKEPARPRTQYASNDSDLVRRIEELRRNNEGGDSDELLEEIKKLLDNVD